MSRTVSALALSLGIVVGFHPLSAKEQAPPRTPVSRMAPVPPESIERGHQIYLQKCIMCHQVDGRGLSHNFPPLAKSDWLRNNRLAAIKALCEGLSGRIEVNGNTFDNVMPVQMLTDQQALDTLNYINNSWGNRDEPFSLGEIAAAREQTSLKTYELLVRANSYPPIPQPPAGYKTREVAQLPESCTRMATNGKGKGVYLLTITSGVIYLDPATGQITPLWKAGDFLDLEAGNVISLGMMQDAEDRLWIVTNQRIEKGVKIYQNEVTIWRTSAIKDGHPAAPKVWFRTRIPHGQNFNHGLGHLALGPDGMLYVNSGARTDGGEVSTAPHILHEGEVDLTACIWRMDPKSEDPKPEVWARGIRNAYGFAWDLQGHLFSVSNGPDVNAAEEMDVIEKGKHYGFPYQYANWPLLPKPYPYTPNPPKEVEFTKPVKNIGPAAGGSPEGMYTFDPHSSPGGIIWCGNDFPAPIGNGFLMGRFGNVLGEKRTGIKNDVGFDVVAIHPTQLADGTWEAHVESVLAPLGRPIDVVHNGPGHVLILEYTRPTNFKDGLGWLPGRVIELSAE
jgi:glucose/arabinose dehydrogenase